MKSKINNDSEETKVSSESVHTPVLTPLVMGMDAIGALIVLGMMVIVNIDVFGRWLFDAPLSGTLELTEMGIVAVVYLQLARTIRAKRLTRSDTFLNFLAKMKYQATNQSLHLIFNLTGASVFLIISYGQLPRLIDAWSRGYYKGNIGIFTAPTWPLEGIMFLGALTAAIQFLVLAYSNLSTLRNK